MTVPTGRRHRHAAPHAAPRAAPRRPRWPWVFLAALVVFAVAVTVAVVAVRRHHAATRTPEATVLDYLSELARGDAAGALTDALPTPASPFTTATVLAAQQQLARISDPTAVAAATPGAVAAATSGATADVTAHYRFGDRSVSATFHLVRAGGRWLLSAPTRQLDLSSVRDIAGLTLFGRPVSGVVRVFPGPLTFGSTNDLLAVTDSNAAQFATDPLDASAPDLQVALSPDGVTKIKVAVSAALAHCAASKELAPSACPQRETDTHAEAGTATWTLTSDLSSAVFELSPTSSTTVDAAGVVAWTCSYGYLDITGATLTQTDTGVTTDLHRQLSIDISAANPKITFRATPD